MKTTYHSNGKSVPLDDLIALHRQRPITRDQAQSIASAREKRSRQK